MNQRRAASAAASFSPDDLDLLASTADALSAYLGKPVLAEVGETEGTPWAVFGIPLAADAPAEDADEPGTRWQMGGGGTQRLGNSGGLAPSPDDVHDCRLLWAIQLTGPGGDGERYVKLEAGDEVTAWSDVLADLLPFGASPLLFDDLPELEDDDDEDDDDILLPGPDPVRR